MDWYAWLCRAGLHPDVAFEYALLFARNELGAADVRHLDHEFLLSMGVAVAKHRLEILKLARKESSSSHGSKAAVVAAAAITVLPWRATRLLAAAVHRSARSALGRLRASVSSSRATRDRDRRASAVTPFATPRLPLLAVRHHRAGGRVAHSSWTKIAASSPMSVRGGGKRPLPALPALPMLTHGVGKPVLLTNSCADKWWSKSSGAAVRALPDPAGSIAAACLMSTADDVCSCDEDEEGSDVEVVVVDGGGEEEMRWEAMFQDLKPT